MTLNELLAMLDEAVEDGFGNCEVKILVDGTDQEYVVDGYRKIVNVTKKNVVKSIKVIARKEQRAC